MADPLLKFRWGTALEESPAGTPERGIYIDDNVTKSNSLWGNSPILAALMNPEYLLYREHFHAGGYSRDLALASESDPSARFSEVADAGEWLVTNVDGGADNGETIVVSDTLHGGYLEITTNDADDDLVSMQKNGLCVTPQAGKDIWFETKFRVNDSDTADWFIGLAAATTGVLAAVTNVLGFIVAAGDSSEVINIVGDKATAEDANSTGVSIANTTDVTMGFYVNGVTSVTCWANNAIVTAAAIATANIPIVALSPIIECRNASAAASVFSVDYMWLLAEL